MSQEHQEIVIIKRHHGDHDEHHGGVWKIAFADFMTAMMAFFLVMWLIAANDKTRATIARYFNPVKLVDATVRPPGMHDPKETDATVPKTPDMDVQGRSKDVGHKQPEGPPPSESPVGRLARLDSTLRTNPFVALAEIVGPQGASDVPKKDADRATPPVIGRQGGPAFRDPFAPPPQSAEAEQNANDDSDNPLDILTPPPAPTIPAVPVSAATVPAATVPGAAVAAPAKLDAPTLNAAVLKNDAKAQADVAAAAAAKTEQRDRELAKSLVDTETAAGQGAGGPEIKVRRTDEGLLVSLTDTKDFSMFSSGSAVPDRPFVLMMDKLAKILSSRKGAVVIRGYTDNKPFKTGHYDNWNLSIDRAQAAHYMLVRGGFPDARISSVEGLADRGAPSGLDPASPRNRRIEILIKDGGK